MIEKYPGFSITKKSKPSWKAITSETNKKLTEHLFKKNIRDSIVSRHWNLTATDKNHPLANIPHQHGNKVFETEILKNDVLTALNIALEIYDQDSSQPLIFWTDTSIKRWVRVHEEIEVADINKDLWSLLIFGEVFEDESDISDIWENGNEQYIQMAQERFPKIKDEDFYYEVLAKKENPPAAQTQSSKQHKKPKTPEIDTKEIKPPKLDIVVKSDVVVHPVEKPINNLSVMLFGIIFILVLGVISYFHFNVGKKTNITEDVLSNEQNFPNRLEILIAKIHDEHGGPGFSETLKTHYKNLKLPDTMALLISQTNESVDTELEARSLGQKYNKDIVLYGTLDDNDNLVIKCEIINKSLKIPAYVDNVISVQMENRAEFSHNLGDSKGFNELIFWLLAFNAKYHEDYPKALTYFDSTISLSNNKLNAMAQKFSCYLIMNDTIHAGSTIKYLIQAYPYNASIHTLAGISAFLIEKDTNTSISHLEKAIELNHDYLYAYKVLKYINKIALNYEKSEYAAKQELRLTGDTAVFYADMADTYFDKNEDISCNIFLEKLLKKHPLHPTGYILKALSLQQQQKHSQVIKILDESKIESQRAEFADEVLNFLYILKARSCYFELRFEEAICYYDQANMAEQTFGEDIPVYLSLDWVVLLDSHFRTGNNRKVISLFNSITTKQQVFQIRKDKNTSILIHTMEPEILIGGYISESSYLLKENYLDAIMVYKQALLKLIEFQSNIIDFLNIQIRKHPEFLDLYFWQIDEYIEQKKIHSALQTFEQIRQKKLLNNEPSRTYDLTSRLFRLVQKSDKFYHSTPKQDLINLYNRIIKIDSIQSGYYHRRGKTYYSLRNIDLAIKDFKKTEQLMESQQSKALSTSLSDILEKGVPMSFRPIKNGKSNGIMGYISSSPHIFTENYWLLGHCYLLQKADPNLVCDYMTAYLNSTGTTGKYLRHAYLVRGQMNMRLKEGWASIYDFKNFIKLMNNENDIFTLNETIISQFKYYNNPKDAIRAVLSQKNSKFQVQIDSLKRIYLNYKE